MTNVRCLWETESRHRFAVDVLNCLDKLPVDYSALLGGIGKTVSKLKKHEHASVKQLADGLVKKWKGVAGKHKESATGATAGALNPAKRERSLTSTHTGLGYCFGLKYRKGNEEGIALGEGFGDLDGRRIGFSDTWFSVKQVVKIFLEFVRASSTRIIDK